MRTGPWIGILLMLVLAATAAAATAPGPIASVSGNCGLAAYHEPGSADQHPLVTVTTPTADGLRFEGSCGTFDGFNFAPDLSQYFLGGSYAFTMGLAAPGVLRLYAEVGAQGSPALYGTGFVVGQNPFRASAQVGVSVGFADVIVPPAGSGAPNVGDATTIKAVFRLDCVESDLVSLVNTGAGVWVYTPSEYANDGSQYDGVSLNTVSGLGHSLCELTNAELKNEFAATVGTPVVVAFRIGTSVQTSVLPAFIGLSSIAKYVLSMNALNTATLEITSADGAPLTGQSGKTYGPPGSLPTVTTSSTVTTTSSAPPTTTTLAGCAGTCGDGSVQPACGETCDCAATADPIQAAYGCDGESIVPAQEACMTCRGCRVVDARCAEVVPATTTTIAGATTTTTSVDGGTTTTTLPGACAGTSGIAAAGCIIDAFLAEALCPDAPPPSKIEGGFRKKLGAVRATLGRAVSASGKKRVRLLRGATKKLTGIGKRATKLGGKKLSQACAGRVGDLVDRASSLIEQAP